MTLRKFGTGKILQETEESESAKTAKTAWTPKDAEELKKENAE